MPMVGGRVESVPILRRQIRKDWTGMRKATPLKPIRPRASDTKLQMQQFGIEPEKHAEFKEAMLSAARAAVEQFPANLEAVKKELRETFPESILTAFFSYGMQASLGPSGEQHKALPDILQHHGELLHALVLTLPIGDWGKKPLTPDVMNRLFDTVPRLSDTFFMQRVLDGEAVQDEEAHVVLSLQERIRFQTHGVRNWGYFDNVVALSRDLYSALDQGLSAHHGLSMPPRAASGCGAGRGSGPWRCRPSRPRPTASCGWRGRPTRRWPTGRHSRPARCICRIGSRTNG